MTTASQPAWAHGFDLSELRAARNIFAEAEEGRVFSRFGGTDDAAIAKARAEGRFHGGPDDGWAAIGHQRDRLTSFRDFRGERVRLPSDMFVINKLACRPEAGHDLAAWLADFRLERAAAWVLEDDPVVGKALRHAGWHETPVTKIAAGSERRVLWCTPEPSLREAWGRAVPPFAETIALAVNLPIPVRSAAFAATLEHAKRVAEWAPHYSSYDLDRGWEAVALRGFDPSDPGFMEKPSEMSRRWKADHPEMLDAEVGDTELMTAAVLELLSALPTSSVDRVRFMRLAPGARLGRHADITDPDAGLADGRVARLHLPLKTNPAVRFEAWPLRGSSGSAHMRLGVWSYLDTRKPHAASNRSDKERIHLVADIHSSPELRAMLVDGWTMAVA